MADHPNLELGSSCNSSELDGKMGPQKISVLDHKNIQKSESFVIDMESFSSGSGKEVSANSAFIRSLSRKASHRGTKNKISPNGAAHDGEASSPTGAGGGCSTTEEPEGVVSDLLTSQVHQITISTNNNSNPSPMAIVDRSVAFRRSSFRRSQPLCYLDPRKIMLFMATLSSLGTILLICLTLSVGKYNGSPENGFD